VSVLFGSGKSSLPDDGLMTINAAYMFSILPTAVNSSAPTIVRGVSRKTLLFSSKNKKSPDDNAGGFEISFFRFTF
jgi:hypothetical protein